MLHILSHSIVVYIVLAAACMTWELAESGRHFITSVVNGADLVPTFSAASVDDLRSEVIIEFNCYMFNLQWDLCSHMNF